LALIRYGRNSEATLVFSSLYIHESEGVAGVDKGTGWFQSAEIVVRKAVTSDFAGSWPCSIYTGETEIDGAVHSNTFPLPFQCTRTFRMFVEVLDDNGDIYRIEVSGTGAEFVLLGEKGESENFG
jgi:hypothetical protein